MNFVFVADVETDRVAPNDEFEHYRWTDSTAGLECPPNVRQLFNIAKNAGRDPAAVARQWIIKFNERDLEGLLNLYSEDAVHVSPKLRARRPETGGRVRGRAALRDWYLDAFARLPHLKYIEKHISVSEGRAVLEYERVNPGEENMMVAEVYSIMDGKIIESFVYHG
ncbi:MAG: nuclear transport factor 2 family protein [Planctomycetes bacterium]|nr:nuclear transport factor 2 family protein [Planctomycetota bacterium]